MEPHEGSLMWQRWMIVHKICLKTVLPVLRLLPHRLANTLLGVMGRLDLIVVPNQTRLYEAAVADGARRLGRDWNIRSVSRALGRQTYRWRTRDLLLDGRSDAGVSPWFHVSGRDRLDDALARGRGVILLANHFGAHVLISHWMFRRGYPVRWFGERPRNVSSYLTRQLETDGPLGQSRLFLSRRAGVTDAASSIAQAARILNAGMILKIASDVRWTTGKVADAVFLNRRESFAASWVYLAAMTGAAVVPAFCRLDEAGMYHLEFDESFHVPSSARRGPELAPWVQQALDGVERRVREHPEQSNDYFFWEAAADLHKAS
jgi:phosphatidylinositol dimannoside acyltransferase